MQLSLIFALFIALLAVIFSVQNTSPVTINFLFWNFEGSLALILLITLVTGVIIGFLTSSPSLLKSRSAISTQKKKIAELEASLAEQGTQLGEAKIRLEEKDK